MIQHIASAAEEQVNATEEISKDIEAVADITGKTASNMQGVTQVSHEIAELASSLRASVAMFRLSDERRQATDMKEDIDDNAAKGF